MTRKGLQNLRWLLLVYFLSLVAACSQLRMPFHSVYTFNSSETKVYNYQITYGDHKFPKKPLEALYLGSWVGDSRNMEVPEVAEVQWESEDGEMHRKTVPILDQLPLGSRLKNGFRIKFEFNEGELSVFYENKISPLEYGSKKIY